MKIYSATPFFNENELFKIRCHELSSLDVVHVVVESEITHSGKPKPLYFRKDGLEQFNIRYVVIQQDNVSPMANENYHRNQIMAGLADATDEDAVLLSDLDEIPRASVIAEYGLHMGIRYLEMENFGFWLNCKCGNVWRRAAILPFKMLRTMTPQQVRDGSGPTMGHDDGWHIAWLGGLDAVMEKFAAFCHQEPGVQAHANREVLEKKIETGQSLWGQDFWSIVPIDSTFPQYLQDHQDEFKHMIK